MRLYSCVNGAHPVCKVYEHPEITTIRAHDLIARLFLYVYFTYNSVVRRVRCLNPPTNFFFYAINLFEVL